MTNKARNDYEIGKFEEQTELTKSSVRSVLVDGNGSKIDVVRNNLSVIIADQITEVVDLYFCHEKATTNPTVALSLDDRQITVADTTGAVVGECINIREDVYFFQAIIQSIVGNVITFNAFIDYPFTTEASVCFAEWNMAVDGSVTPVIFTICPPANATWDLTRIIGNITDSSAMDDGLFGGTPSLSNGVILRVSDGYDKNIFIVSDNGGFTERAYDARYSDKAPAGLYGFSFRRTFAGQNKNGVVIRLDGSTNDQLQLIIQDDLTDLVKFACVAQGHRTN